MYLNKDNKVSLRADLSHLMSRFCTKKESKWSRDPLGSMKVTSSIVIFMNPSPSTTLPVTWPSFLSSTVVLLFLVITLSHLC